MFTNGRVGVAVGDGEKWAENHSTSYLGRTPIKSLNSIMTLIYTAVHNNRRWFFNLKIRITHLHRNV